MQRLFSSFPDGRPGAGLLLLRLAAGSSMLLPLQPSLIRGGSWPAIVTASAAIVVAGLLFIGFMTPVAGAVAALAALLSPAFSVYVLSISVAIVLLGPGAFALDARLFGRREIVIVDRKRAAASTR